MDTTEPSNHMKPKRVAVFLQGVDSDIDGDLDEVVAAVVEDAEARGLFFEWAAIGDMDLDDVVNNSPLHQALMGRPPDR